jgi:hypothetical protein
VGWRGEEYLVVVVESGSEAIVRHATFRADQLGEMVALLRAHGDDPNCVIDTASEQPLRHRDGHAQLGDRTLLRRRARAHG